MFRNQKYLIQTLSRTNQQQSVIGAIQISTEI